MGTGEEKLEINGDSRMTGIETRSIKTTSDSIMS